MKKKIIAILIGLLQTVWAGAQIYDLTPGEISISASSPFSDGLTPSSEGYQQLIDCGFNIAVMRGTADYLKQQFKLIGNKNFRLIVGSTDFLKENSPRFVEYVRELGKYPQLAAWYFTDEPTYDNLNKYRKIYSSLRRQDPSRVLFLNLVGVLEKTFTGNLKSFPDYLNLIQSQFAPDIWSFDYYPILIKKGDLIVNYEQFFSDLEYFRNISLKTGKPFWSFCECMEYKTPSYSRPAATEVYLRWAAFSALAYGAQGIAYWTYGMRNSNKVENYISALTTMKGEKTRAWYSAQKVNGEIKKFNHIFYKCRVKDVRHTGKKIFKGTKKLSGSYGPLKMVRSGDDGVVVSLINNNGKEYVMIMNHSVTNNQNISIELLPNVSIKDLTESSESVLNWREEISFILPKGGYKLYQKL